MNSQNVRGTRLVAFYAVQHAFDETLLEFLDGFVK